MCSDVSRVSMSSMCLCGCVCVGAVFVWHLADVYMLGMSLLKDVYVFGSTFHSQTCVLVFIYARMNIFECASGCKHKVCFFSVFFIF